MGKNSLVRSQIQTQSFQISLKFRDSNLDLQTDSSVLNTPRYKASGSKLANSLPIIAALQLSSRNWTVSNLLPLYSCFSTLIFTVAGSNPSTNNFGHPGSNPATASSSYWVYRLRCTMVGVRLWTYSLLITLASITFNVHFHHCKFKSYKASDSYMRVYH